MGESATTLSSTPVVAAHLAQRFGDLRVHALVLRCGPGVQRHFLHQEGKRKGNETNGAAPCRRSTILSATRVTAHAQSTQNYTGSYAYNGDGLRTSKVSGGTTSSFAWDQSSSNALLLSDGANYYVYGPDGLPLEQIKSSDSSTVWFDHDTLGNTRLLTDSSSNMAANYNYDTYGNVTAAAGRVDTPLRYRGEFQDTESGLTYLRARYYDPQSAQFLTVDPLVAATRSAYGYVDNSPLNATDPSGLLCFNNPLNRNDNCRSAADTYHWVHVGRDVATGVAAVASAVIIGAVVAGGSAVAGAGAVAEEAATAVSLPAFSESTVASVTTSSQALSRGVSIGERALQKKIGRCVAGKPGYEAWKGMKFDQQTAEALIKDILQNPVATGTSKGYSEAHNVSGQGVRMSEDLSSFVTFVTRSLASF